jgi:dephospho-CoA kinase
MIITITGKSGSGKTTLCQYLKAKIPKTKIISADLVGHEILKWEGVKKTLVGIYSDNILTDGVLNRNILRKIATGDIRKYNQIIHPLLKNELRKLIDQSDQSAPIIVDSALIEELDLQNITDSILLIKRSVKDNDMAQIQKEYCCPDYTIHNITKNILFKEGLNIVNTLLLKSKT